ncbi:cathepsin B-like [Oppia nitens]|uniref:cathepsin B-like n=1 Tax=Oppia nitens TaxID=1686743 RepID=UPI0023DA428A|nr:cathepsin B-like [Oppia nitens]
MMLLILLATFLTFTTNSLQLSTNYEDVNELINYINNLNTTWKAGKNSYTSEDIKVRLGALEEPDLVFLKHEIDENIEIPESFDAREEWPHCESIKEIRDQGSCGSCWALAVVEAISDRICIATKGQQQVEISAENLIACCDTCGMGCMGGWSFASWDFYVNTGYVTGGLYNSKKGCQPYSIAGCGSGPLPPCKKVLEPTPQCQHKCIDGYNMTYAEDKHYGKKSYGFSNDNKALQIDIMQNGPVVTSFTVYDDFAIYKSGVYQRTSGQVVGGHAVKVIGWGVENGVDYWIVANSWNTYWGDKGFFKIRRGTNECNFEID